MTKKLKIATIACLSMFVLSMTSAPATAYAAEVTPTTLVASETTESKVGIESITDQVNDLGIVPENIDPSVAVVKIWAWNIALKTWMWTLVRK